MICGRSRSSNSSISNDEALQRKVTLGLSRLRLAVGFTLSVGLVHTYAYFDLLSGKKVIFTNKRKLSIRTKNYFWCFNGVLWPSSPRTAFGLIVSHKKRVLAQRHGRRTKCFLVKTTYS